MSEFASIVERLERGEVRRSDDNNNDVIDRFIVRMIDAGIFPHSSAAAVNISRMTSLLYVALFSIVYIILRSFSARGMLDPNDDLFNV